MEKSTCTFLKRDLYCDEIKVQQIFFPSSQRAFWFFLFVAVGRADVWTGTVLGRFWESAGLPRRDGGATVLFLLHQRIFGPLDELLKKELFVCCVRWHRNFHVEATRVPFQDLQITMETVDSKFTAHLNSQNRWEIVSKRGKFFVFNFMQRSGVQIR